MDFILDLVIDGWTARPDMSTIDTRREQMLPKLEPRALDRLRRFGEIRRYAAGEALFVTGPRHVRVD
jgi:hypothetical protein